MIIPLKRLLSIHAIRIYCRGEEGWEREREREMWRRKGGRAERRNVAPEPPRTLFSYLFFSEDLEK